MKTNTYLGLMSLQLAGSTLQQNRLAKEQAERDRELQRITSEAAQAAQNAHYAQWRVTPEGQQFEAWKSVAAPASETILARNDIWNAVRNGSIESARANAQAGPVNDDDIRKKTRIYGIATAALWTLAILLVGIAGQSEGALTALGGVFCLAAIAATILLILNVKKGGQRRITAQSNAVAAVLRGDDLDQLDGTARAQHPGTQLHRFHPKRAENVIGQPGHDQSVIATSIAVTLDPLRHEAQQRADMLFLQIPGAAHTLRGLVHVVVNLCEVMQRNLQASPNRDFS